MKQQPLGPPPTPPPPPPPKSFLDSSAGNSGDSHRRHSSNNSNVPPWSPSFTGHDVETPLIGSRTKKTHLLSAYGSNAPPPPPGGPPPRAPPLNYSSIPKDTPQTTATSSPDKDNGDNEDDKSVSTTSSGSSFSTVSSLAENFKESLLLPFTDEDGTNVGRGLAALAVIGTLLGLLMMEITKATTTTTAQDDNGESESTTSSWLNYLSSICGYNYLILWSVCFYPQAIQNYRRQSTKGVSPDFALLNWMGWTYYTIYMGCLFFQPSIRESYEERFHEKSTVALNDVLFATHATTFACIYVLQILYYSSKKSSSSTRKIKDTTNTTNKIKRKRICLPPTLKLKNTTKQLVAVMGIPTVILPVLILSGVAATYSFGWLDYLYMLSFFKIACTLTKYTKQTYMNYERKSTKGWNIWYNFLEASGGSLSMIQICLDAIMIHDWSGITGNLAKFLLGFATLTFDCIFFLQHYVWYRHDDDDDDEEENVDPKFNPQHYSPKKIPKHLRANSRFEIVIPSSPVITTTSAAALMEQQGPGNQLQNYQYHPLSAVKERENNNSGGGGELSRLASDISLGSAGSGSATGSESWLGL